MEREVVLALLYLGPEFFFESIAHVPVPMGQHHEGQMLPVLVAGLYHKRRSSSPAEPDERSAHIPLQREKEIEMERERERERKNSLA